jgi:hypothetical protein
MRDSWQVTVNGRGRDNAPLELGLIAICVMFPERTSDPATVSVEPITERDEILPIIASTCLVSALLLAFALVIVARVRARPRRGPQPQVSVVLRSHHSSFRLNDFREVQ